MQIKYAALLVLIVFASFGAFAQEKTEESASGPTPDEVTTGEMRISLSSDYAKLLVDGEQWEEHEFIDNGKTLVIHGLKRTEQHKISLTPIYPDLSPVELSIKPDEWKLATVGKNVKMWRVGKKVTFSRAQKPAVKPAPQKDTSATSSPAKTEDTGK